MPVYEYECEKCGRVHEVWQGVNDAPMAECPECKGAVAKIISRSTFQLKGGGWYADGYGNCSSAASCDAKSEKVSADGKGCSCCA